MPKLNDSFSRSALGAFRKSRLDARGIPDDAPSLWFASLLPHPVLTFGVCDVANLADPTNSSWRAVSAGPNVFVCHCSDTHVFTPFGYGRRTPLYISGSYSFDLRNYDNGSYFQLAQAPKLFGSTLWAMAMRSGDGSTRIHYWNEALKTWMLIELSLPAGWFFGGKPVELYPPHNMSYGGALFRSPTGRMFAVGAQKHQSTPSIARLLALFYSDDEWQTHTKVDFTTLPGVGSSPEAMPLTCTTQDGGHP